MAILVSTFFILSTADLGSYWAYVRRAFIAHGETAETTAIALDEYPTWYLAMMGVADANAVLADCVIVSNNQYPASDITLTLQDRYGVPGLFGERIGRSPCFLSY